MGFLKDAKPRVLVLVGPSSTDATDLKRPRTAPTAPIDAGANGANLSAGKGSDPDGHIANPADLHPHQPNATRPATTASAPAALNRTLRPQPSVSTASPTAISSASRHIGAISGVVAAPQPQQQMQLQPQQQQQLCQSGEEGSNVNVGHDQPPLQRHQQQELAVQQEQQQWETAATAAVPAAAAAAAAPAAGPVLAAASGSSDTSSGWAPHGSGNGGGGPATRNYHQNHHQNHHTPHHSDLHHRHDALEEQVFSPAFHLPSSSSPASSNTSPQAASRVGLPLVAAASGGGGKPSQGNCDAAEAATTVTVAMATAAAVVVAAADGSQSVEVRTSHHHGSECMHLHAIDLNVVDGVQVDTDDDELAVGVEAVTTAAAAALMAAAASAAVAVEDAAAALRQGRHSGGGEAVAAATTVTVSREPAGSQLSGPPGKRGEELGAESSVSDSGAAIEAVGEELSSSSSEEGDAKAEGGRSGVGDSRGSFDDEAEFLECDENDENVPISLLSGLGGHALSVMASEVGTIISIPQQQQRQLPGEAGADAVLVASAPRGLAAAVSAAVASAAVTQVVPQSVQQLQLPQQTQLPEEELEDEDDEEGLMEFDPLVFIKQLPPLESCVPQHRRTLLPRQTRTMARRKTLVLDLDETLVHSSLEAVDRSDFSFPVVFNGTEHQVYVRQRPHLLDFMVRVSALFEVVVFTASQRIYAERLLDILDPHQQLVRHRIYRDSCVVVDGNYLKDLSVLGRDLAHTVIVDNSPQAFGFQVGSALCPRTRQPLLRLYIYSSCLSTLCG
ncbi:hypothetical protein Vafri_19898 [Volvox africanus]|uniref:FCP1 homology domain-containing protein n=1 Tax=Volvox africanus TaxID=51714 RepID=A0A8J4BVP3_9CHLO|nr:hypothetical protein Vafri_19898 [Volvox africanus]